MMTEDVPQFGIKSEETYKERSCVYGVVSNKMGSLLILRVGETYHLPGGGIDSGEDPAAAFIRETREEAGCEITDLQYLGKANQFFSHTKIGPLNKLGVFYKGRMIKSDSLLKVETDHEIFWVTRDESINLLTADFQKWAVKKAF